MRPWGRDGTCDVARGLGDPVLWGAVAFLLNYVPILGPMLGLVTFTRPAY
jgi:hypothetical protein